MIAQILQDKHKVVGDINSLNLLVLPYIYVMQCFINFLLRPAYVFLYKCFI